jgi:hypothetical protein
MIASAFSSQMRRYSAATIAVATVVTGVLGTGIAFAYYGASVSGSKTGTATVSVALQPITISTNATAGSLLQPGGKGDLVITANNPNSFAVKLTALNLGTVTGCTTPALSLVTPATGYLPLTLQANTNTRYVLSGALAMGSSSSDCQGKSLTITLTPTVRY